nr:reverse transcriptase domain-containing protein [Tanacetum cinerariifolium]
MNTASSSGSGTLPSNTITNPKENLKGITTRSGSAYKGPTIPTTSSLPKVVERKTEMTKDTVPPTNNGSTKDVQPSVVQVETHIPNSEPVVAPVFEPVEAPISALKPNLKPSIPYPSRLHDQKLREKANYILVAVDYLLKSVEAKALPTNDTRFVCKFLKSLFARFGTPRAIIRDHSENRASWSDKLDDALRAFRTAFRTPIGFTPYKLVYEKACHLPIELEHNAYWAMNHWNYDL